MRAIRGERLPIELALGEELSLACLEVYGVRGHGCAFLTD